MPVIGARHNSRTRNAITKHSLKTEIIRMKMPTTQQRTDRTTVSVYCVVLFRSLRSHAYYFFPHFDAFLIHIHYSIEFYESILSVQFFAFDPYPKASTSLHREILYCNKIPTTNLKVYIPNVCVCVCTYASR